MSRLGRGVVCAILAGFAVAPSVAFAQQPTITLQASASQVRSGSPVTLSGQATEPPAGAQVVLYAAPYPYTAPAQAATATPDANGYFSFTVSPDLDTRYLLQLQGTSAQASVQI